MLDPAEPARVRRPTLQACESCSGTPLPAERRKEATGSLVLKFVFVPGLDLGFKLVPGLVHAWGESQGRMQKEDVILHCWLVGFHLELEHETIRQLLRVL